MRVFYAIFLQKEPLASGIDGLRLLADPHERQRTHITLRGPYRKHVKLKKPDEILQRAEIVVCDAGCFWDNNQNTVFLGVYSDALRSVIHKPDYPTSLPHLTVYDGTNRNVAEKIYSLLKAKDICFRFDSSPLRPIVSTPKQQSFSVCDLWETIDRAFVSDIVGFSFDRVTLLSMSIEERIAAFSHLLNRLVEQGILKIRRSSVGTGGVVVPFKSAA